MWQWSVRHIGMRYWTKTDVLVMALPREHGNIANFCHDILIVSNIPAKRGSFAHCSVNVGPSSTRLPSIVTTSGGWPVIAGITRMSAASWLGTGVYDIALSH